MKKSNLRLLSLSVFLSISAAASAQLGHGLAIDIGKTNKTDSTHVTNFSIGLTSHTDSLKGAQLNFLSNYAWNVK